MQCYAPPEAWTGARVALDADESRHLFAALRKRPGDEVAVFDGAGQRATAVVEEGAPGAPAVLRLLNTTRAPPPALEITLVQALPREQQMDLIVQKATELGLGVLRPVETEHGVARVAGRGAKKQARWERIALSAAKQCGRAWLPRIHPATDLATAAQAVADADVVLYGALEDDARPLKDVLAAPRRPAPSRMAAFVGPEGDFSDAEKTLLREGGARPVSLGPSVLRVETAALYLVSALRYEFL